MDLFALAVKHIYLPRKVNRSLPLAKVMPRRSLPKLGQAKDGKITMELAEAVNKHCGKLQYKADPFNGLYDIYNHPEHTQYLLETGDYGPSANDCDDYQGLARGLFRAAGVAPENHWEWNAIVPLFSQFSQGRYNHVICGFQDDRGDIGVIDTNSAARGQVFWFPGHTKEEAKKAVLATFSRIYPANYYALVEGNWLDYC